MPRLDAKDLATFTGGLVRFRHWYNRRLIYTEGVNHVAEKGEAYWLIDEIALHLASRPFVEQVKQHPRIGEMHFWKLRVNRSSVAELTAREDSGILPFFSRMIPFTDFPLAEIDIWAAFDGEHWTLYLPSEH